MNVLKSSNLISFVPKFTIRERGIIIIVISKVLKVVIMIANYDILYFTRVIFDQCVSLHCSGPEDPALYHH